MGFDWRTVDVVGHAPEAVRVDPPTRHGDSANLSTALVRVEFSNLWPGSGEYKIQPRQSPLLTDVIAGEL